ncbi:TonB-dependent receptor [Tellurirhabdus rosea]|uniref:TonB-dependent receptor n=1 Tax=Tellurirhabdus rosea TaxID=2674997 RepID=UPI00225C3FF3|nr:TonB-dependent receptor [Tellurirhabdus rosea]
MKQFFFLTLTALLTAFGAVAQERVTVSGYIKDAANGEGLIGATVQVRGQSLGAAANEYGFYSLTLPKGSYELVWSYVGYEPLTRTVALTAGQKMDVQLKSADVQMQEVVVKTTKPEQNVTSLEMGVSKLEMKTVKAMPALLGEVDVVRSIQLLPGVSTVGEGATGFNVRGGNIDQNLILLDEAPVYNSSHLLGFFSVFNPDAVKDLKLVKGGIPAQYGGRLSSLLDVRMKEGNSKQFSVSGGIGTVSSRLTVEGPIRKDKSSFIVTGRRSYADLFLKASPNQDLRNNIAYFYDLTVKVNNTIGPKDKVFVSGYFGADVFSLKSPDSGDFRMSWKNKTATVRWNHLFSDRLFANFTGVYSDYYYNLGVPSGPQAFDWTSNIYNYSGKADFTYYLSTRNTVSFGAQAIRHRFTPGNVKQEREGSIVNPISMPEKHAMEYAAYLDNEQSIGRKLSLQYGLRLSAYQYLGAGTTYDYVGEPNRKLTPTNPQTYGKNEAIATYANLEPRFSLRYSVDASSSIKATYNRTAQYIHLISSSTAASPLDLWYPTTSNVKPERADQVAVGYFRNFKENAIEASVEGFYKTMENQIDYRDGAQTLLNEHLEGDLMYGRGRAYGAEFYLKKNTGRLNGWVSYTLSRSERKVAGLSNDEWYAAKYDRRHMLSVVGIYNLNKRLSLSANFAYNTGVATTAPNARYEWDGMTLPHNTTNNRNAFRVPAYHRLDLSATLQGKRNPTRRWQGEWVFSVYNAYGRRNAFTVYFRQAENNPQQTEAVRLSILGAVLPSVTYNFKF